MLYSICNFLRTTCFLSLVAITIGFSNFALAAESICPGSSSKRADITWCADYENYSATACQSNPKSQQCSDANGGAAVGTNSSFAITQSAQAAVGSGAIQGVAPSGGTGPGYHNLPAALFPTTAFSLRYYVKFSDGYLHVSSGAANHAPAPIINGTNCSGSIGLDWHSEGFSARRTGSCGVPEFAIAVNGTPWIPKNNRWYLIEMQAKMNTVGGTSFGSNGVFKLWVDGALLYNYQNINLGGTAGAKFVTLYGARSYYGHGIPEWQGTLWFDNFAYSNNATYIGAANSENARGTADPDSPYINYASYDGHMLQKMANDCTPGVSVSKFCPLGTDYRDTNAESFVTNIAHNGFINLCSTSPDKSMKVTITSTNNGGGYRYGLNGNPNAYVINGWIYLPTGNNYNAVTLAGFQRYGGINGGSDHGLNIGLAVNNGKWALRQRPGRVANDQFFAATSNLNVVFNTWHSFELFFDRSNKISLMINGQWVIDEHVTNPNIAADIWNGTPPGGRGAVIGVQEFDGTPNFTVYYDDMHTLTASASSCRGWNHASCPFVPCPTPHTVYLQNQTVSTPRLETATVKIAAGNSVNSSAPTGAFNVGASGDLTLHAGDSIVLAPGFSVKTGGRLYTRIQDTTCQ